MLDKNDRKYIIRRVITYIAIAMIMFFISSCQAKALNIESVNYELPRMYITSNGIQSEYQVQQEVFLGSNMQGYNGTAINFQKFAFEIPLLMREKMHQYEYISFYTYNTQAQQPIAEINGIQCEISQTTYIFSAGSGNDVTNVNVNNGYTGYLCRLNYSDSPYINFYTGGGVKASNRILISKTFTFYNTGEGETASAINDVNNSLNDSTPPTSSDISGNSSDWNQYNTSSGAINDLVLMPITLLNSFVNGINNTCSSYDLGELWGEHLILPCINLSQTLGAVWTLIDVIISGVFIFVFGKQCVKIFNDFTNLKSGQIDTLYGGGN